MAKIKFGMMMTDARGKLGGQVFSKNRSGSYVRTKVTPVNPRTSSQQANRSLLGNISSEWSGLTETQRSSWNGVVSDWQKTDIFGDQQKPTGKNLFTSLNKNLLSAFVGSGILVDPPAKGSFSIISGFTAQVFAATGNATLTLAGQELTDKTFVVRATGSLSPGVSYFKNELRRIGASFTANASSQLVLGTSYAEKFGVPVAGANIFFEVTEILENGQLGVPLVVSAEIVA